MTRYGSLAELNRDLVGCRRCPRLVAWREEVARQKRAAFRDQEYWGRPVPGFGDPAGRLLVVGLAPAAHGANRTGRMFTGDRSGDWLYRALHTAGFASQPTASHADDGLELSGAYIAAPVHCAPPANRPTPSERDACSHWFVEEVRLAAPAVIVCLGQFGYVQALRALAALGRDLPRPRVRFGHGVEVPIPGGPTLLCSYHVSQQNTFTGKLTEAMLDAVFARARELLGNPRNGG